MLGTVINGGEASLRSWIDGVWTVMYHTGVNGTPDGSEENQKIFGRIRSKQKSERLTNAKKNSDILKDSKKKSEVLTSRAEKSELLDGSSSDTRFFLFDTV